jgi:hypothetical protein
MSIEVCVAGVEIKWRCEACPARVNKAKVLVGFSSQSFDGVAGSPSRGHAFRQYTSPPTRPKGPVAPPESGLRVPPADPSITRLVLGFRMVQSPAKVTEEQLHRL